MSLFVRVALAAVVSCAFASNAMAQKKQSLVKPFTVAEKMLFDRASALAGGEANGGGAGGGDAGQ